jgi:hypothetical protein
VPAVGRDHKLANVEELALALGVPDAGEGVLGAPPVIFEFLSGAVARELTL